MGVFYQKRSRNIIVLQLSFVYFCTGKALIEHSWKGLLQNRLTRVGENNLENMLNLAQKPHPVVKILVFPIIFETTARVLRQEHFFDQHVIVFVKNDRITISVPIILSINQWRLSYKKASYGQWYTYLN